MNLLDLMTDPYPITPGYKTRDTSEAAAQAVVGKVPRLRQMCIDVLRRSEGLTADECAERLEIDKLSIRPRFSELARMGRIEDSGERRLNESLKRAIVWKMVS